jgi:4-amino-4-deoxy-L-arabinose transferase-like glycosyltransferase
MDVSLFELKMMPGAPWKRAILLLPLVYVLYLHGIRDFGLVGPDEPRYSSIAREMARSGDWITPRLWGDAWFEKPALLYWMEGLAFRAGLGPELAPRLPVALLSLGFLTLFWFVLRREFGERAAWFASLALGTCAGWLGFSAVGATDLPLAATFSAAILLALPWVGSGDARRLPLASACLGAAVLAKGLVPLMLVVPLLGMERRRWRDLAAVRTIAPFLLVAGPWYLLCWLRNGKAFFNEFFVEHHFSRFTSGALMHGQPWWFYAPVLLAGLLPWTPLLALLPGARIWGDRRTRLLAAVAAWGFLFFSASTNKLPGYLLPLLPPVAALCGIGLDRARGARAALAVCVLLLTGYLAGAQLLAPALAAGLSRAGRPMPDWTWALPAVVAGAAWMLEARGRRPAAVWLAALGVAGCVLQIKTVAYPAIDRIVSARSLWRQVEPVRERVCVDLSLHRSFRYGLNYYSVVPLPDCDVAARPLQLVQPPGAEPVLRPAPAPDASRANGPVLDLVTRAVVPSPFRN